jgi:hypothetical protein
MAQTNVQAFSGDVEITSNLAVNTNDLFVDTENSRVGIGTVNPKTPLEVRQSAGYFRSMYIQKYLGAGPELDTSYVLLLKSESNTPKRFSGKISGVRGYATNNNTFEAEIIAGIGRLEDLSGRMTFTFSGNADKFYAKLVSLTYNSSTYIALALIPTANYNGMSGGIYFNGKTNAIDELQYITDLGTLSNIVDLPVSDGNKTTFTGNVGIGTTEPGAPLHIHDVTDMNTSSEVLSLNRGSSGDDIESASRGTIGMYLQDTALRYEVARMSWQHDGTDGSTEGYGKLGFWTSASSGGGPTERMTIDKDGKVGIGTTDPIAPLDVLTAAGGTGLYVRSSTFGQNNQATHIRIGAGGGATAAHHAMITGGHTTSGSSYLSFSTITDAATDGYDPVERMRIDRIGNVGIGTASPRQMFHVNNTGYGVFSGRLGVGNVLTSAQNGGGQDHWNLGTSAKLVVRSPQGGNPTVSYANARAYAGIAFVPEFDASDTTNMGLWGSTSGENPVLYIQGQVNNGGNGGGRIALQPVAGNVGIGVTDPSQKLHVNGALRVGHVYIKYGSISGVSSGTGIYTGLGANAGSGGGFILLAASWHTSSGSATGSFALAIRKQYSGAENKYPYNNYNQLHFNDGSAVNSYTLYTDSGGVVKFLFNETIAVCKWAAFEIQ